MVYSLLAWHDLVGPNQSLLGGANCLNHLGYNFKNGIFESYCKLYGKSALQSIRWDG